MNKRTISYSALALVLSCSGLSVQSALAQDDEIEEIVTVGSRSAKPRSASDSTVPIDVLNGEDFNSIGGTADLTDNLKALVPSYTATPATGDGSAFVRNTSLRGTAPDQTLVLVNGKRRHRSALVQFFAPAAGNGAHGPDVGMIPGIAVKRVEVLRDGASSQYGSDAIAGVINFEMKDASSGGEIQVQYGEHYEGEQGVKVAGNGGFAIGDSGFVNASFEVIDNEALSRGIQRPDEATLLAAGVPLSVIGADAPFGDAPLLQTWGRPETSGVRVFVNSGFDISATSQLYAHLGVAETDGRYRFFYRTPDHSSLTDLRAAGFTGLPAGYTPFLDGAQDDATLVVGLKGEFDNGMLYDVSYGYGKNELDYFLNNTVNPDLGLDANGNIPKRDFDVGGYAQEENNLNVDFSIPSGDNVNVAFGAEVREEKYTVFAGEIDSHTGAGSNGFGGIRPSDSGEFTRDNIAVYADVEHDVSDALLTQYALRYENFSDFGTTTNAKLAFRYRVSDALAFRGAVSTGFHAPTPGQSNVRTTITTFDGMTGLQVEEGLISATDPRAINFGGAALTEEKSLNYSLGFSADLSDNWSATVDVYRIEVDDRIYRTGDLQSPIPGTTPQAFETISFYTNALDVEHSGVDVVLTGGFDWGASSASTDVTFAYAFNKIEIAGQKPVGPNQVFPVSAALVDDIENNYPESRFTLSANTFFNDQWSLLARATYYGAHFDERGIRGVDTAKIDEVIYFDLELGWQATDNVKVAIGGTNIFDEFIDEIGPPNANRLSVGLQYPRRTAANYEGGSWYLKGIYSWQ